MTSLLALAALAVFGVGGAAADDEPVAKPPLFGGLMNFPLIHGTSDPEQFFWEVLLGPHRELVQVDERNAHILFEDGTVVGAITAEQARDTNGVEVPTSFEVIAPNLVSLTVHHRAGNPAADGSPFRYPVMAGPPYEVGYSTVTVIMPRGEDPPASTCTVPRLTGRSLAASRKRLAAANCQLGAVRGKRGKGVRVVKQFKPVGSVLGGGARVAVKLG